MRYEQLFAHTKGQLESIWRELLEADSPAEKASRYRELRLNSMTHMEVCERLENQNLALCKKAKKLRDSVAKNNKQ